MKGPDSPKALLVQPPVYDYALYDLFLKPYGLLRIGKWLADSGWDVVFVNGLDYEDPASAAILGAPKRKPDGTGKFFRKVVPAPSSVAGVRERPFARYGMIPESFRAAIEAAGGSGRQPDLILLSTGMTYWYLGAREAARTCRSVFPRVPLAVGGIYASLMPEHCARATGADFVVRGEAEPELRSILTGLGLPSPGGRLPSAPLHVPGVFRDAEVLRLNAGCPFRCDYCASHRITPNFEPGDPDSLFRALRDSVTLGTLNFAFYDDALLVRREDILFPFLDRVIETYGPADQRPAGAGPLFYLPNAVHVRYIDRRTALLLRDAGFRDVRLGFESASADFHEAHDGKFLPESFPAAVDALLSAGFPGESLSVYILAGLPGQRADETEDSIHYALRFGLRVRLAEFSPVPGSSLWEDCLRLSRYPLADEPLFHDNSFFPMEWDGFTWADLERLKAIARTNRRR